MPRRRGASRSSHPHWAPQRRTRSLALPLILRAVRVSGAAEVSEPPAITTTGQRYQSSTLREAERVPAPQLANDNRKPVMATKPMVVTTRPKQRIGDGPHLPMELPLSRKPIERDGDDYKRMKAAMARRLRGADE